MSVGEVVAHAVQQCKQGDYGTLASIVEKYERKVEHLESQLCECVTARFEAQTLQQLLAKERSAHRELKQMYEVLLFRTKYQLTGALTEDRVMDNSSATIDRQARTIFESFGIPEVPAAVEASSFATTEQYVAGLESAAAALRSIVLAHMKPALMAQISERLMLKRAMEASSVAERNREDTIMELRKELLETREEGAQKLKLVTAELFEAKKRIASFDSQLAAEIERSQAVSVQREKDLEAYVLGLQQELEPLRVKEVECAELQRDLEAAKGLTNELSEKIGLTEKNTKRRIVEAKHGTLSLLRRISHSVGICMPVLAGKPSTHPEASPDAESDALGPDAREAERAIDAEMEQELDERVSFEVQQLEVALASATTLASTVTLPQAAATQMKKERSVVASIAATKTKLEKLMQRLDPAVLDSDITGVVRESIALDDTADEAQEELRHALGLEPGGTEADELLPSPRMGEEREVREDASPPQQGSAVFSSPHRLAPLSTGGAAGESVMPSGRPSAIAAIKEALLKRNLPDVARHMNAVDSVRLTNLTKCAMLLETAQEKFAASNAFVLPPLDQIQVVPRLSVGPLRATGGKVRGKLLRPLEHEVHPSQQKAPRLVVKPRRSDTSSV